MRAWCLAITAPLWLAGPTVAGQPKFAPSPLRRVGETTLFSFVTSRGKQAILCEGPRGTYLVYRFGTATKLELQYPRVLDASSWQKFTYWEYHRGGGAHNAGRDTHQLSFSTGKTTYELVDETVDSYTKGHGEIERREVGIRVRSGNNNLFIAGKEASADWYLQLDDRQRKKVKLFGLPTAE